MADEYMLVLPWRHIVEVVGDAFAIVIKHAKDVADRAPGQYRRARCRLHDDLFAERFEFALIFVIDLFLVKFV